MILPPKAVKAITETGWPSGRRPRQRLRSQAPGETNVVGRTKVTAWLATARALDERGRLNTQNTAIGPQHDVRIEHHHERFEVTGSGGGEECVDHFSLLAQGRRREPPMSLAADASRGS